MRTIKSKGFGISRSILLSLAIAALLAVPAIFTGCQSSGNSDTSGVASTTDVTGDVEPLTLATVSAKVSLNSDQQSQLKDALQAYNQERETRRASRANGNWRAGVAKGDAPMTTLLTDCADFLDTKQMTALVTVIKEQRASAFKNRAERADGHGRGMRQGNKGSGFAGRMLDSLTAQLDLTDDQIQAIKAMHESRREEFQMRRRGAQRGERPAMDNENGRPEFHQQMREELDKILTEAQIQKLDDLQEARRSEHQDRMQEFAQERLESRADYLAQVLKLDATQQSQLGTILTHQHEQQQQLHESFANGTQDRKEIREQMPQLREQSESEIRGLLTDEQAALFDALQDLRPQGARRGPRPL